jgi:uncharacterized protein with NAD-binding domain and iron-sulfur cluster
MNIAIVGAGVSGLVAAHVLRERHSITVFESATYAGGHTNTIHVDTADATHHVETGFIVFNDRNYPNFVKLLDKLGVAHRPSHMSFAVADDRGDFEYSRTTSARAIWLPPYGLASRPSCAVKPTSFGTCRHSSEWTSATTGGRRAGEPLSPCTSKTVSAESEHSRRPRPWPAAS